MNDTRPVTADELEGNYFCYPITCSECGIELAGAEDNGEIGRGDVLAISSAGESLCQNHPGLAAFAAAGTYAYGGGTPCEPNNRAFKVEDVVEVR